MLSVSIITTCKGRLHHLMEALPSWKKQRYKGKIEIIVVDYQCPQNTSSILENAHPDVRRVMALHPKGLFNQSHARNVGAWSATGDILAFIDADSILTPAAVLTGVSEMSRKASHLSVYKDGPVMFGSCFVKTERYHAVRGYDETLANYGYDDIDMYRRIESQGVPIVTLGMGTISRLEHDNESRVAFYTEKTTATNFKNKDRCRNIGRTVNPLCYGYPVYGEVPNEGYGTKAILVGE